MSLRPDLAAVADAVPPGARVLDVGCGDGALLAYLRDRKGVDARGIDVLAGNVASAVARGLSVVQGDADADLGDYPDGAFDMVILSDTLQAMRAPAAVLGELVRIGRRGIVSFPNFGHWRVRASVVFGGRMPVTATLPVSWHQTPNIHLCTIDDFRELVTDLGLRIESATFLSGGRRRNGNLANLMAEQAVFVLGRGV
ncbi:methionine biosynthesis protein MetW [Polymorphobacter fuscus]|uniref:Methionine biosynthesis protein MetW n=1 Tax=Sandarakinorhabdus fusca TaxID=1439888 RepID=A0A7C9KZZ9_9SPHN|nr:methionine biosynthesis protein MetW [Polymorphobacter fuscus]KAB7643887.1 methionine biosynthesis protein MetW [Polymorphobacter fuscus]MQT18588.1 methionine biosynthesis protein MetW [Polymorphobacter fuscus]NJC07045.1 methionine biosynthesis protein MetW [Polymorphobacter fuscus]